MNVLNVLLSAALIIFIVGSAYIIKMDSKKKQADNKPPTFISTKFSETNLRTGPSKDYPVIYTYTIKKIPLRVLDIHREWYQVEDIYGQKGWVYKNLVNLSRNGIILKEVDVKISNSQRAKTIAIIQPYNIVKILDCNSIQRLCKIEFFVKEYNINYKGWIPISSIWGDTI